MNQPIDEQFHEFKDETNHNLTMLLGMTWKNGELLRTVKTQMHNRFDHADIRMDALRQDVSQLEIGINDIRSKLAEIISKMSP